MKRNIQEGATSMTGNGQKSYSEAIKKESINNCQTEKGRRKLNYQEIGERKSRHKKLCGRDNNA